MWAIPWLLIAVLITANIQQFRDDFWANDFDPFDVIVRLLISAALGILVFNCPIFR